MQERWRHQGQTPARDLPLIAARLASAIQLDYSRDPAVARVRAGPQYAVLLKRVREAQLDRQIGTEAEALALVDRLVREGAGQRQSG